MTGDTPITLNTPLRFQDNLPQEVDVAIIGGGVVGVFAALYLVRKGRSVALLEKGRIAGEQSSRNWGWIRQQGRDPAEFPIVLEAKHLWSDIDHELRGATGFRQGGVTYLASSEEEMKKMESWLHVAEEFQLETRMFGKKEIDNLVDRKVGGESDKSGKWIAALHTPSDGRAEPWKAVPAVASLAQGEGVVIRENCAVRALEKAAGKLTGIHTEDGLIKCEQAIICAGAWSSLFLRRHGFSIPQLSVRSTVAQTAPLQQILDGAAADEELAWRRREDGGYTLAPNGFSEHFVGRDSVRNFFKYTQMLTKEFSSIRLKPSAPHGYPDNWLTRRSWAEDEESPFERMRVLDPAPNANMVERMGKLFMERFPALGKPVIRHAWAGMIDTMPDIVPVVDRLPGLDGVIVATGMSGHGFGIGPGFGKVIAAMANGEEPGHDLTRFRYKRFHDGSPIDMGPSL